MSEIGDAHSTSFAQELPPGYASLFPMRSVVITLRLARPAHFRFFHNGAVHAYVRHRVQAGDAFSRFFIVLPQERGRVDYQSGETYHFKLLCLPGSEHHLDHFLQYLWVNLPAPDRSERPLGSDSTVVSTACGVKGNEVRRHDQCQLIDSASAEREISSLASLPPTARVSVRLLSPCRILSHDYRERGREKGEDRFCDSSQELSLKHFLLRAFDAVGNRVRELSEVKPLRPKVQINAAVNSNLFWVSTGYAGVNGKYNERGGLLGEIEFNAGDLNYEQWGALVIGQYVGVGQMLAFGYGRYEIERKVARQQTQLAAISSDSLLSLASDTAVLQRAYAAINANRREKRATDGADPDLPPDGLDEVSAEMERARQRLLDTSGDKDRLYGVVHRDPDGDLRALAIPSFIDRVAQRAVIEVIGRSVDALSSAASHGYRRGRSRLTAREAIRHAYLDGYRWVFEADIERFFDSVEWSIIESRLDCLFQDDALCARLMSWVKAPVFYDAHRIERSEGLPQGSPISPVLANLVLDTLDDALDKHGFRLVRYADDFVVLCRDADEANNARVRVTQLLNTIGLKLNDKKSSIVPFDQGFRYLGYLFVKDLVIDSPGRSRKETKKTEPDRPTGWLAALASQTPLVLTPDGEIDDSAERRSLADESAAQSKGDVKADARVESGDEDAAHEHEPMEIDSEAPLHVHRSQRVGTSHDDTLLVVTGLPVTVSTRQKRAIVSRDGETLHEQPWKRTSALVLFGFHHLTAGAIRSALQLDVPIFFASGTGNYQGTLANGRSGYQGSSLWLRQVEVSESDERRIEPCRSLVIRRIQHQAQILRRYPDVAVAEQASKRLESSLTSASTAVDLVELNGVEGYAGRVYFQALQQVIPKRYGFSGRNRRPPKDPFNALLSLGFTLLYGHVDVLLRVNGLLPTVGFYHNTRGRHSALASDMMEPFRHIIERHCVTCVRKNSITIDEFRKDENGGCRLDNEARRRFISGIETTLATPTTERDGQRRTIHEQIDRQIRSWVDELNGVDTFKPWRMR